MSSAGITRRRARAVAAAALALALPACGEELDPADGIADDCRRVELIAAETGQPVRGVEDLAVDPVSGAVWLSAYDRRWQPGESETRPSGGLYRLDPAADLKSGRVMVTEATAGFAAAAPFYPHGIDLHRGPTGDGLLAAINRRHAARHGAPADVAVELFAIERAGLVHRGTVADPAFCRANDLLLLGPGRLLATADHGACAGWRVWLERIAAYPGGHLLLWEAGRVGRVADGLAFANGIARDGGTVAVAETRADRLRLYDLAALLAAANDRRPALPAGSIALPGGPDNLVRGADGRLYAALLPDLFAAFLHQQGWAETVPSRIVRLAPGLEAPAEPVFATDAPPLAGPTAAVAHRDRLLAGAAWDDGLMVCRLAAEPPGEGRGAGFR